MSHKEVQLDENQSLPLQICQACWAPSLPEVMDLNAGQPLFLDQMVHQSVAKTPSDVTIWSWPEPLVFSMLQWSVGTGKDKEQKTAYLSWVPMRFVRIDPQLRAGVTGLDTTERFRAIAEVLSRPIGDFQGNRFFAFPAMLDTKAISLLLEAVRTSTGSQRDEEVYLRCMLLSETMLPTR